MKSALLIGGTGQLGWATAENLLAHGWEVSVASRSGADGPAGTSAVALDRDNTEHLLAEADGMDLVLDAVAYTPEHGAQLARLAGGVGSLVVISTASVYLGRNGTYLDIATGDADFPVFPVPIGEDEPTVDNAEPTYSPQKAALERVLLATPGLPVSILRPGAIHGPHGMFLREWFFVKRALDGRRHAVLAYDAESRFGTSATVNVAELVRLCAEQPGVRALNAVDPAAPSVREIGEAVFAALGHDAELVGMPGPARGDLGGSPWAVPVPLVPSMERAERELGYQPVATYADAVRSAVDWITAAAAGRDWREAFPRMVERWGADGWFPYDEEDDYLRR